MIFLLKKGILKRTPLEDVNFNLGNFMANLSSCNGQEGVKVGEDKLVNFCKMKEKEVTVEEEKVQIDMGEGSNSRKPLKQFKRRKGGSVKEGCYKNQKLCVAPHTAGKLGRFLASMILGIVPLKTERKP
ncbi:hypothetical protein M0R45_007009 [Rubus argutus]|uniref:Uncharacterized protein n=1 Tax=Rubus argutus TaxID=59490 RepID=A0AAW1YS76_RUBAR